MNRTVATSVAVIDAVLLGAILFPVFAKAKSYSGPGLNHRRIAGAILNYRMEQGAWPLDIPNIESRLRRRPPQRTFNIQVSAIATHSATYRITVDRTDQVWRLDPARPPKQLL